MQSTVCSRVRREPRRMVPPMCVRLPSGMNTTAGCGVACAAHQFPYEYINTLLFCHSELSCAHSP